MKTPLLALIDPNMKTPLLVLIISAIILLVIWDGVWKLIALWKSARHGQLAWFICVAIFNTAGILPILYLLCFQKTATPGPDR
jgi:predicted permease